MWLPCVCGHVGPDRSACYEKLEKLEEALQDCAKVVAVVSPLLTLAQPSLTDSSAGSFISDDGSVCP